MQRTNTNAHPSPSVGGNLPAAYPNLKTEPSLRGVFPRRQAQASLNISSPTRQAPTSQSLPPPVTTPASRRRRSSAYRFFPRFGDRGEPYGLKVRSQHEQRSNFQQGGGL